MASHELLQELIEATLASSVAIVLVLLLRRPLRKAFGTNVAYALWALVPLAALAALLPAASMATVRAPLASVMVLPMAPVVATVPAQGGIDWSLLLLALWLAGVLLSTVWQWRAQRAFRRGLGHLLPHADMLRAQAACAGLPATLGLWRPQIVLPADFEARFDAQQQALVLAHERRHIARRDPWANALAAGLRCLFWCNPLLHVAVARMRHDQELACDADVIADQPQLRRRYGDALLITQLTLQAAPLGCHFGFGHPLKERIAMINKPMPSLQRIAAGRVIVTALLLSGGFAVWAAQPKQAVVNGAMQAAADFTIRLALSEDGGTPVNLVDGKAFGEHFQLQTNTEAGQPSIEARVLPVRLQDGTLGFDVALQLRQNGKLLSSPRLVLRNGVAGRIEQGSRQGERFEGIAIDLTVDARDVDAAGKQAQPFAAAQEGTPPVGTVVAASRQANPPAYPADALKEGVTGTVVLVVDIDAQGNVTGLKVERSSGDARLDSAALTAAARWRFQPAREHGKPAASKVRVPVEFAQDKPAAAAQVAG